MGGGGAEGLEPPSPPHIESWGGLSSLIFQMCIPFSMSYTKEASKLLSEGLRNTLLELKIPNFPGGACPQSPLDDYWLFCLKPEPPHFCRAFSALDYVHETALIVVEGWSTEQCVLVTEQECHITSLCV